MMNIGEKILLHGYINYAGIMGWPDYTDEQLKCIQDHRDAILEKYRLEPKPDIDFSEPIVDDYTKLSYDEAINFLKFIDTFKICRTAGMAYAGRIIAPTELDGVIIDACDVFAVGFMTSKKRLVDKECIVAVIFTKDPYIPAYAMMMLGKISGLEISVSRRGRCAIADFLKFLCPNIEYPVQDIHKLAKKIVADGVIDHAVMDMIVKMVSYEIGIFDVAHSDARNAISEALIYVYSGYLDAIQIYDNIGMYEDSGRGRFWRNIAEKAEIDIKPTL